MFSRVACVALGSLLAVAACVVCLSPAGAANFFEKYFWLSGPNYNKDLPSCDSEQALDEIIHNFRTKEARFWNSELAIVGIENVRETAYMPWAAQSIPRRFCSGTALINDGQRHPIYYSIASGTGPIGIDWGTNFCVVGLDRNWAYNPACRSARP